LGIIVKPTNLVDGVIPTAAQFNGDFDTIYSEFNGSITNANVSASAAISESKIAFNTSTGHDHDGTDSKSIALTNPYKFSAYRNAAQNSGNGGFAIVNFDAELFDTNNNFDSVTNKGRYTAPIAGFYQIQASVATIINATQYVIIALYKNGSAIYEGARIYASEQGYQTVNLSTIIQLAANDYIEIFIAGTGGALFVEAGNETRFSGFLVSTT